MGVYIKGMKMPESCRDCCFCGGQVDTGYRVYARCEVDGKDRERQDCPLVHVPDHGRLIDADALPWENQGLMLTDPDEWGLKVWDIEHAPTIIPAEGGET